MCIYIYTYVYSNTIVSYIHNQWILNTLGWEAPQNPTRFFHCFFPIITARNWGISHYQTEPKEIISHNEQNSERLWAYILPYRLYFPDLVYSFSNLTLWRTFTKNYGKSPCYQWVNPRTKSPFSIAFCMFTRPGIFTPCFIPKKPKLGRSISISTSMIVPELAKNPTWQFNIAIEEHHFI